MRVIAGELKGRRLAAPPDSSVRPTTGKVKEAIFSMIQSYLSGAVVVDLFAGTGSLGIEAVSRGAARAYFVDKDRRSLSLVRQNIKHCGIEDRSVLFASDYLSALGKIREPADIIFLDPPYRAGFMQNCLDQLAASDLLPEGGIVVAEHGLEEVLEEQYGTLLLLKNKRYGKIAVSIYEKQEDSDS